MGYQQKKKGKKFTFGNFSENSPFQTIFQVYNVLHNVYDISY